MVVFLLKYHLRHVIFKIKFTLILTGRGFQHIRILNQYRFYMSDIFRLIG